MITQTNTLVWANITIRTILISMIIIVHYRFLMLGSMLTLHTQPKKRLIQLLLQDSAAVFRLLNELRS